MFNVASTELLNKFIGHIHPFGQIASGKKGMSITTRYICEETPYILKILINQEQEDISSTNSKYSSHRKIVKNIIYIFFITLFS